MIKKKTLNAISKLLSQEEGGRFPQGKIEELLTRDIFFQVMIDEFSLFRGVLHSVDPIILKDLLYRANAFEYLEVKRREETHLEIRIVLNEHSTWC